MNRFEKGEVASKKIRTYTAFLLSAFALAACSGQEGSFRYVNTDQGSDEINTCPPDHSHQRSPIRYTASSYNARISQAVGVLSTQMPQNIRGEFLTHFENEASMDAITIRAGEAVFYQKTPGEFEVRSSETKIDDRSEQLCSSDEGLYPTAEVEIAIRAMEAAGINTKALQH